MFFTANLLQGMRRTEAVGYADDTYLISVHNSTKWTCKDIEEDHKRCVQWAARHGAKFAPEKYKVMHFTGNKRMSAEQRRMPNIQLLQGEPEQNMRVLGVTVDRKLNWRAHVNSAVAKVTRVEAAIRRITASTWGTSLRRSRQLYVAMARPAMMYGCECWMPGGTLQTDLVQ